MNMDEFVSFLTKSSKTTKDRTFYEKVATAFERQDVRNIVVSHTNVCSSVHSAGIRA